MTKGGPTPRAVLEPTRVATYACGECAYGVATARLPHRCPMCGGRRWLPLAARRASAVRASSL